MANGRSFGYGVAFYLAAVLLAIACVPMWAYFVTPAITRARQGAAERAREVSIAERIKSLGGDVKWDRGAIVGVDIDTGPFSDEMADNLCKLAHLRRIGQWVDRPSDSAIAKLAKAKGVAAIDFYGPGIADATIGCLKNVNGLACLNIKRASVTDAGLVHLAGFANLRALKLNYVAVTDTGLKHLGRLQSLKDLDLSNTAVTDRGLAYLAGLRHLEVLRLYACPHITAQGIKTLRGALPSTRVAWNLEPILDDWR